VRRCRPTSPTVQCSSSTTHSPRLSTIGSSCDSSTGGPADATVSRLDRGVLSSHARSGRSSLRSWSSPYRPTAEGSASASWSRASTSSTASAASNRVAVRLGQPLGPHLGDPPTRLHPHLLAQRGGQLLLPRAAQQLHLAGDRVEAGGHGRAVGEVDQEAGEGVRRPAHRQLDVDAVTVELRAQERLEPPPQRPCVELARHGDQHRNGLGTGFGAHEHPHPVVAVLRQQAADGGVQRVDVAAEQVVGGQGLEQRRDRLLVVAARHRVFALEDLLELPSQQRHGLGGGPFGPAGEHTHESADTDDRARVVDQGQIELLERDLAVDVGHPCQARDGDERAWHRRRRLAQRLVVAAQEAQARGGIDRADGSLACASWAVAHGEPPGAEQHPMAAEQPVDQRHRLVDLVVGERAACVVGHLVGGRGHQLAHRVVVVGGQEDGGEHGLEVGQQGGGPVGREPRVELDLEEALGLGCAPRGAELGEVTAGVAGAAVGERGGAQGAEPPAPQLLVDGRDDEVAVLTGDLHDRPHRDRAVEGALVGREDAERDGRRPASVGERERVLEALGQRGGRDVGSDLDAAEHGPRRTPMRAPQGCDGARRPWRPPRSASSARVLHRLVRATSQAIEGAGTRR